MTFDPGFVLVGLKAVVYAFPTTFVLAAVPFLAGILLGVPAAVARQFQVKVLAPFLNGLFLIIKGIPEVLLVLLVNYLVLKPIDFLAQTHEWARALQKMDKIHIGIIALSIYAVVMISETAKSALHAVGRGQYEAAAAVGLTRSQMLRRIILPQAVPIMLPMLCNNTIGIIKATSIVYLISVNDMLSAAQNSAAINFRYLEGYVAAALVYWAVNSAVERLFYFLEKKSTLVTGGKTV